MHTAFELTTLMAAMPLVKAKERSPPSIAAICSSSIVLRVRAARAEERHMQRR